MKEKTLKSERLMSKDEVAALLGVTRQTVSNWIRRGILHLHEVGRFHLLDRASIESMFDSLEELKRSEERIHQLRQEYSSAVSDLESLLSEVRRSSALFPNDVQVGSELRHLAVKMVSGLYAHYLNETESDILSKLLQGEDLSSLAVRYRHTRDWVLKVARKACLRLLRAKDLDKIIQERNALLSLTERLDEVVRRQQERIDALSHRDELIRRGITQEEIALSRLLLMPLRDAGFSIRTLNCLRFIGVEKVADLLQYSYNDLLKLRNFGKTSLREVIGFLEGNGLQPGMETESVLERYTLYQSEYINKGAPLRKIP